MPAESTKPGPAEAGVHPAGVVAEAAEPVRHQAAHAATAAGLMCRPKDR